MWKLHKEIVNTILNCEFKCDRINLLKISLELIILSDNKPITQEHQLHWEIQIPEAAFKPTQLKYPKGLFRLQAASI